jgi:hypothetical protein
MYKCAVYIQYVWQGIHVIYGHIQCIYTRFWLTLCVAICACLTSFVHNNVVTWVTCSRVEHKQARSTSVRLLLLCGIDMEIQNTCRAQAGTQQAHSTSACRFTHWGYVSRTEGMFHALRVRFTHWGYVSRTEGRRCCLVSAIVQQHCLLQYGCATCHE